MDCTRYWEPVASTPGPFGLPPRRRVFFAEQVTPNAEVSRIIYGMKSVRFSFNDSSDLMVKRCDTAAVSNIFTAFKASYGLLVVFHHPVLHKSDPPKEFFVETKHILFTGKAEPRDLHPFILFRTQVASYRFLQFCLKSGSIADIFGRRQWSPTDWIPFDRYLM